MSHTYQATAAIIAKLKVYTDLTDLLSTYQSAPSVFSHVPQNMGDNYPYVVLYDAETLTEDTDVSLRFDGTFTIHSWSDQSDTGIIANIQGAIYGALHRQDLTMTDYCTIEMHQEFDTILRDPDGITLHGVQRYRLILQTNS